MHRKEVSQRDSCNRCLSQALFRFFRKGFKKTEHHIYSQCLLGFETQTDVASARHTKKDGGRFVGIGNFSLFRVRINPGPLFPHGRNRKEVFHRGNSRRNNGYRLVETSPYITQFGIIVPRLASILKPFHFYGLGFSNDKQISGSSGC